MTTTKRCPKCEKTKDFTEFGNYCSRRGGLQVYCKRCRAQEQWDYRQTLAGQVTQQKYRESFKGKESRQNSANRHYKKYPEKLKAHNTFRHACEAGRLIRASICEYCGGDKAIEGHHPDYDKPLEVIWVCKKCHMKLHNELILV